MVRLLSDEDVPTLLVRALKRAKPTIDVVRVQDVGLLGAEDPDVLGWAAVHGRIVLSRDKATLRDHAVLRIRAGERMPGLSLLRTGWRSHIQEVVSDILIVDGASEASDWEWKVEYLPWRPRAPKRRPRGQ